MIASWQKDNDKPRQCVEKQRHYFADKGPYSQGYGLPSGHVWMWELDRKESRMPKNWCLWTVVLEKTPESPLHKEVKSVSLKGHQPWIFTGKTDDEAETPVFWSSNVNRWLIGKDPDAGEDWRGEENEMTEDEMVRWHHQLDRHEFEQALGVGDGQESLACCSPWGSQSDTTGQLNWTVDFCGSLGNLGLSLLLGMTF